MKWPWSRNRGRPQVVFEQMNAALGKALPEIEGAVAHLYERSPEEPPGPYWVYDEVLNPYIEKLLDEEAATGQALTRVFGFVEHLAASTDQRVRHVVADTILGRLEGEPRLALARRYMGPATRRLLKKVQT